MIIAPRNARKSLARVVVLAAIYTSPLSEVVVNSNPASSGEKDAPHPDSLPVCTCAVPARFFSFHPLRTTRPPATRSRESEAFNLVKRKTDSPISGERHEPKAS